MSKAENKKRTAVLTGALVAAFAVPLIALAVVYMSRNLKNDFAPADINISIEENEAEPHEVATKSMTFSLADNGGYSAEKQVKVLSNGTADESALQVKIVPVWYEENSGNICGSIEGSIGNISDMRYQRLNEEGNSLEFLNVYNELILSCRLDEYWEEKWSYDSAKEVFIYKDKLDKGKKTSALISSVEIPSSVYEASEGYELHIDVLADTIQTDGEADEKRY